MSGGNFFKLWEDLVSLAMWRDQYETRPGHILSWYFWQRICLENLGGCRYGPVNWPFNLLEGETNGVKKVPDLKEFEVTYKWYEIIGADIKSVFGADIKSVNGWCRRR